MSRLKAQPKVVRFNFPPPSVEDIDDFLGRIDRGEISIDLSGGSIYSLETGPSLSQFGSQVWAQVNVNGVTFAEDIVALDQSAKWQCKFMDTGDRAIYRILPHPKWEL